MGIFGPSPREIELDSKLSQLSDQLNLARDHMLKVDTENGQLRAAARVHRVAMRALKAAQSNGDIQISAEETALGVVKERYEGHVVARIADSIIDEREAMLMHDEAPNWDEEIRARLTETFTHDGTFDGLETQLRASRIQTIADELRQEKSEEIEAKYDDPAMRDAMVAEQRKLLEDSGEFTEMEELTRAALRHQWRATAIEQAQADIDAALEEEKKGYVEEIKENWSDSYDGRRYTESRRGEYRRLWNEATAEELREVTDANEFIALVDELVEAKVPLVEKEVLHEKYLKGFIDVGMNTEAIDPHHTLVLELGSITYPLVEERDKKYGSLTKSKKKTANVNRRLTLTSLGENRFRVEEDTMAKSKSPIEREYAALSHGTIIHLGRKVTDKKIEVLEPQLRQGIRLYIDDDTTDPHITDTLMEIVQVSMDNIRADQTIKQTLEGF